MKDVYERGELAMQILGLFVVGGAVVAFAVFPGFAHIARLFGARNTRDRQRIKQSMRHLEKGGFIKRRVRNGKEEMVLTKKGERQVRWHMVYELTITPQKKWDGTWRIIMFDIPDTKSRERQLVSSKLKEMGMHPIQRSVFVSPYPCKKEFELIGEHLGIQEHLAYLESDVVESSEDLLKIFRLK